MKTPAASSRARPAARRCAQGFTLPEMVVAVGVFVLVMTGIIYGYLFGLRLYEITVIKLGANDDARKAFIRLTDEVRSANKVRIGTWNPATTNFTEAATNALQQGPAVMIFPSTNLNNWIVYYYQTNAPNTNGFNANYTKLLRTTDGVIYNQVIAHSITNTSPLFTAEDYAGNVLTNNLNNRVIGLQLHFYQMEYPVVSIGPGNYFDSYQIHTRITRRTLY